MGRRENYWVLIHFKFINESFIGNLIDNLTSKNDNINFSS
jgi:hypothetical protein